MRVSGRLGAAISLLLLLSSCVSRPAPPPPAPPPLPAEPAPEPPLPPPPPADWEDAQATPGDWRLAETAGAPSALYGGAAPLFAVRCEPGRRIALIRPNVRTGAALVVRTSYGARTLPAAVRADGLAAALPASDPLLDAIAFSRGRFAVEAAGAPRLVIPAWPEPARVIEDCRS